MPVSIYAQHQPVRCQKGVPRKECPERSAAQKGVPPNHSAQKGVPPNHSKWLRLRVENSQPFAALLPPFQSVLVVFGNHIQTAGECCHPQPIAETASKLDMMQRRASRSGNCSTPWLA
jgi:hypothetical protein